VTKLKQWSISAGNNFNNVIKFGTSETLCNETVVNLENVKPISFHVPKHLKPLNDEQFGHYLAGLIDGDGHFSSKQQLVIVFHKLDVSLAYYIKERVGFGSVKKVQNKNAYLLIIAAREGLEKVINLINGKIRTENKFNQITNNILSHPKFCGKTISLKLNLDIDLKNHWLAGFSDASATFQIKLITRTDQEQPDWTLIPSSKALPAETRIVVWGKILFSSVGLGRYTKQVSNMIRIPAYQQSVITGLILSDGWLIFASKTSKSARLGFKQSLSNSAYFLFVFSLLSPYFSSIPTLISAKRKETNTYALQIFTRSLPCFTELLSIYYPNGIKRIPADIFNLLTPIALAHWIMGDGNKNRHGLTISTESFSLNDTVRLINVLMVRYRLDCTMRKKSPGYTIYIKEKSMPLLRTLVQPHMHSSMLYKLRMNTDVKYTTPVNLSEDISSKRHDLVKLTKKDDASFQIKILNRNRCSKPLASATGKSKKVEIRLNFQIDQKKDVLLLLIKNFLGGNIGYRKSKDTENEILYTYDSSSLGSARKIIKYFDNYHLLSHKHVDYLKWRKTYCRLIEINKNLVTCERESDWYKKFYKKISSIGSTSNRKYSTQTNLNLCLTLASTCTESKTLHPFWVTGFSDGDSTFTVKFKKRQNSTWQIIPVFAIGLHMKDQAILLQLKSFFNEIGIVSLDTKNNKAYFTVQKIKDLNSIIIPHFESYPLQTDKKINFDLWAEIVKIMISKEHLKKEGFLNILSLKSNLNRGLSKTLIAEFPEIKLIKRPLLELNTTPLDNNWISGFVAAEGSFSITISEKDERQFPQVRARFSIGLNLKDKESLLKIKNQLNIGNIYSINKDMCLFEVASLKDIKLYIIPFFNETKLNNIKNLDFLDFKEIVFLMDNGEHLSERGIILIKDIKSRMNLRRSRQGLGLI